MNETFLAKARCEFLNDQSANVQRRGRPGRRCVAEIDRVACFLDKEIVHHGAIPPDGLGPDACRRRLQVLGSNLWQQAPERRDERLLAQRPQDLAGADPPMLGGEPKKAGIGE